MTRPGGHEEGSRLSALGSRLSALGSRLSALGSRLSALGSRLSALGSRLSALGSRLSALGSRLSALGSRLSALGSRLSALGSRLSALLFLRHRRISDSPIRIRPNRRQAALYSRIFPNCPYSFPAVRLRIVLYRRSWRFPVQRPASAGIQSDSVSVLRCRVNRYVATGCTSLLRGSRRRRLGWRRASPSV